LFENEFLVASTFSNADELEYGAKKTSPFTGQVLSDEQ
jgi:hypothetical protein